LLAGEGSDQLADFIGGLCFSFRDESGRGANLAWRTVTALKCVVVDERTM
jgi:hypothetical protein